MYDALDIDIQYTLGIDVQDTAFKHLQTIVYKYRQMIGYIRISHTHRQTQTHRHTERHTQTHRTRGSALPALFVVLHEQEVPILRLL